MDAGALPVDVDSLQLGLPGVAGAAGRTVVVQGHGVGREGDVDGSFGLGGHRENQPGLRW